MFGMLKNVKVTRVLNSVVAGTSAQTGTGVDMSGYNGVMFLALLGTLTAGQVTSLKAQQSSDDGSADDYTDLTGTLVGPMADGDSNKMLLLDVFKPGKQYVRPYLSRATQNAVIDGIIAIQYNAEKAPITQGTTVSASEFWPSPAEGTA